MADQLIGGQIDGGRDDGRPADPGAAPTPATISRRDLLGQGARFGGLAAVGAFALHYGAVPAGAAPAAQSSIPGTVTIPLASNPTPNPITVPTGLSGILLDKSLFGQLVRPDPETGQPGPDLAESWTISEDGLTYTFALRQGVTWHDGSPFTADDVKFTFDAMMDPAVNATFLPNLGPLTGATVVDPATVQLTLSAPYSPFLLMLAYNIMMVPKAILEGQDINAPTAFIENPIGTGPYRWQEFVSGDHITLVANESYWDGPPAIGTLVYKILPDGNTQVAQLRTGEVDMVMIEPSQSDALQGDANVVINTANQTNIYYISINKNNPLFADTRVRQAMCYAMDRQLIVDSVMRGAGSVATGPISPPMDWAFPADQQPLPYDVDQAKALLAEVGWVEEDGRLMREGQPFSFRLMVDAGNPTRGNIVLAAQQYWTELGMEVEIESLDFNTWYTRITGADWDTAMNWWITPADPNAIQSEYADGQGVHGYDNPQVNDLFAQGRVAISPEERAPIYAQIQQLLYQDMVHVFIAYPQEFRAFSARLQGYSSIGVRDALYYTYRWTVAG